MLQVENVQSTGKTIKLSEILALMEEGKTRKEINAIYGETDAAMKQKVWSHPKLKNKKSAKPVNFAFEDDTEEVSANLGTVDVAQTLAEVASASVAEYFAPPVETEEEGVAVEETVDTDAPVGDAPATLTTQRGTW